MKRWANVIFQAAGFAGQVIVPAFVVNPNSRMTAHGIIGAIQGIVGIIAHQYNPDGTSARVAYIPPVKGSPPVNMGDWEAKK